MIVHHKKKKGSSPPNGNGWGYSLEADPNGWMEQASSGALVSNTDIRIAFDKGEEKDQLVMRVFIKSLGWQPCQYLARERDEEGNAIGYRLSVSLDRLPPDKQEAFKRLTPTFMTADLKRIRQEQEAGSSNGAVGELLGEYEAAGLIEKTNRKRGEWRRLA